MMRTTVVPVLVTVLLGGAWYLIVVGHTNLGVSIVALTPWIYVLWRRWLYKRGLERGPDDLYREDLVSVVCIYGLVAFLVVLAVLERGADRTIAGIGAVLIGGMATWGTYSVARKTRARRAEGEL